jgi:hypothetical protein
MLVLIFLKDTSGPTVDRPQDRYKYEADNGENDGKQGSITTCKLKVAIAFIPPVNKDDLARSTGRSLQRPAIPPPDDAISTSAKGHISNDALR